jgi:hypothetical protein
MRTISAIIIAALSGALAVPPAFGQIGIVPGRDVAPPNPYFDSVETTFRLDAGLVAIPDPGENLENQLLFDVSAGVELEVLTENGRRWGVVGALRAERDSGRRGWGGRIGNCPPGTGDCATVLVAGVAHAVRNPVSGFHTSGAGGADDTRLAVEEAYGFVHTGWGELRLGYGAGAADIDAERGPTAFRLSRADGGRVDLTGLSGARTTNMTSGRSPKIMFRSIQLGQVSSVGVGRVTVSYTPAVRECGVDVCASEYGPAGLLSPVFDDVVELGGRYEIHRGEHEFAASVGYALGQDATDRAGFDHIRTVDFGLSWRRGDWRAGARWLRSNSGATGDGDYEAWSISGGYEIGDWLAALEFAVFSDDLVHVDGRSAQLSASKLLGDRWVVGGGLQAAEREDPVISLGGRRRVLLENTQLFVELGWQF